MPSYTYQVQVGKNVASLKSYHNPKMPRFRLQELGPGKLSSQTDAKGFEVPFIIIFSSLVLGLVAYLFYTWDKLPPYATITLGSLFAGAGVIILFWGIGTISKRAGVKIDGKDGLLWKRFFWITRKRPLKENKPDYVCCTASLDREIRGCYILDVCLHCPQPVGMLSVTHMKGYAQIPEDKGAQYKPYETALVESHEKAQEIAKELKLELHPNFSGGPVSDVLRKFFDTDEDEEEANDAEEKADDDEKDGEEEKD